MTYSTKNTVRQQPVSKSIYQAGETTVIRLPTNAIVDLHTLNVQFDLQLGVQGATLNLNNGSYLYDTMAGGALNSVAGDAAPPPNYAGPVLKHGAAVVGQDTITSGSFDATRAVPLVGPPRYVESLVRRVDITMGGVQVGLGSLSDYGAIFNLLALNTLGADKHKDMSKYELNAASSGLFDAFGGGQSYACALDRNDAAATVALSPLLPCTQPPTQGQQQPYTYTAPWRNHLRNWLGFLGGNYMRFLDTNLLPDVEIRITWNSGNVLNGPLMAVPHIGTNAKYGPLQTPYYQYQTGLTTFAVSNIKADFETIAFGDNSYRLMLDDRLATGEPIIVPFTNWSSFETGNGGSNSSVTQFTVATQSLDALYGTARPSQYDSAVACRPPGVGFSLANAVPGVPNCASGIPGLSNPPGMVQVPYYQFIARDAAGLSRYYFTVDSKNYPQFYADTDDSFEVTKNSFDGGALSRGFESVLPTRNNWKDWAWALGVSLMHNSDDTYRDRMISGLNTNGSNIPVTFNMTGMNNADRTPNTDFRPIVFCELTSTLMIYAGRVISVIN